MAELILSIRNSLGELSVAANSATQFLQSMNVSRGVIFAANLAIEEIITNTIKYGYDDELAHEIVLRLDLSESVLRIEISDDGREFNPFDQPEPALVPSPEGPSIGGLGIHFVRKMLDSRAYCRRGGRNIIKLSKRR